MSQPGALLDYLSSREPLFEAALLARVEARWAAAPRSLVDAMRYSLFAGGKRLRPLIAVAAAEAVGGKPLGPVLELACAVELVHTYSLIHDDLPCMDDDDLRRGKPTSHRVFGEALAILAGDALLTEAFSFIARIGGDLGARLTGELAAGAGAAGMVGGQALDVAATGGRRSFEEIEQIHRGKTAALIAVAAAGGGLAGGAGEASVVSLRDYGRAVGLAFQAADDWLDVEAPAEARGKRSGRDAERGKVTLVSELGVDGAKRAARRWMDRAIQLAEQLPEPRWLVAIARYAVERES